MDDNMGLYGGLMVGADGAVYYLGDSYRDEDYYMVSGTLKRYVNGEVEVIADNVYAYQCLENGVLVYLEGYDDEAGVGNLYSYYGGERMKLAGGIMGMCQQGVVNQRESWWPQMGEGGT